MIQVKFVNHDDLKIRPGVKSRAEKSIIYSLSQLIKYREDAEVVVTSSLNKDGSFQVKIRVVGRPEVGTAKDHKVQRAINKARQNLLRKIYANKTGHTSKVVAIDSVDYGIPSKAEQERLVYDYYNDKQLLDDWADDDIYNDDKIYDEDDEFIDMFKNRNANRRLDRDYYDNWCGDSSKVKIAKLKSEDFQRNYMASDDYYFDAGLESKYSENFWRDETDNSVGKEGLSWGNEIDYSRIPEKVFKENNEVEKPILVKSNTAHPNEMSVEDAVREFTNVNNKKQPLMFKNKENHKLSMLFHRKDNNIGWIEPGSDATYHF